MTSRVLVVGAERRTSGGEVVLHHLVRGLAERQGMRVDVLVPEGAEVAARMRADPGCANVRVRTSPHLVRFGEAGPIRWLTSVVRGGREILELGVIPLENMLPEVAYIKLGWALGAHPDDPTAARRRMTDVIAGEVTEREPHDGYLVLQGGVPEVQEFLEKVWK